MPTLPLDSFASMFTHSEFSEKCGGNTKNQPGFSFHILCLIWFDYSSKSKFPVLGKYFILGHAEKLVEFIFLKTISLTLLVLHMLSGKEGA